MSKQSLSHYSATRFLSIATGMSLAYSVPQASTRGDFHGQNLIFYAVFSFDVGVRDSERRQGPSDG
jgi:hypothetical protein